MKFINKLFLILAVTLTISSCEMFELEPLLDNPNAPTEDQASIPDLFNSAQLNYNGVINGTYFYSASMTRMVANINAYDYQNASSPVTFDGLWFTAYASLIPDLDLLISLTEPISLNVHAGIAKIMKAHTLTMLVDLFNDVPFSEINKGVEIVSPRADSGAEVYAAADALLQEAITQLSSAANNGPSSDIFYGGSAASWLKAAKSLRLRNAVTTRLVNGEAASIINSLVSEGDIIDEASEDFQFQYGNNRLNPNSRHPFFNNHYEAADGSYMSTYYMWLLASEKRDTAGEPFNDPRLRYYFYRQSSSSSDLDVNVYSCHLSNLPDQDEKPAYYDAVDPALPYCILPDMEGYLGRDHLNAEGIPPDGFLRTQYGLYPGAGKFDDNSFVGENENGEAGGFGQGITPILLSSFVDFMRAEAALTLNTNDDPRALLEKGVRAAISKVLSFESLVSGDLSRVITTPRETFTVQERYAATEEDVEAYVAYVMDEYDKTDDKLNIVMREYFIALFGNGLEAYNMYRRTGKPNNMMPAVESNPGSFARSAYYPQTYILRNQNAVQKLNTTPVFWDNNPDGFVY